jgi:hypothetical protein
LTQFVFALSTSEAENYRDRHRSFHPSLLSRTAVWTQ